MDTPLVRILAAGKTHKDRMDLTSWLIGDSPLDNPTLVLCGYHGCGKTVVENLIRLYVLDEYGQELPQNAILEARSSDDVLAVVDPDAVFVFVEVPR
jgi:hypothetical protein